MSPPGFWEWIFLIVLALLIFGPDKLPGMARSAGKLLGQLKREAASTMDELKRSADLEELRKAGDDLRSSTKDLKAQMSLTGPVADTEQTASGGKTATARALIRPPFDPDAT